MEAGRLENIFSIGLIVGFFLPWISFAGLFSFSGYEIPDAIRGLNQIAGTFGSDSSDLSTAATLSYSLYLIPLLAIVTLVFTNTGRETNIIGTLTGLVPLTMFIYYWIRVGNSVFDGISIGVYTTLLSALGLIIFSWKKIDLSNSNSRKISVKP